MRWGPARVLFVSLLICSKEQGVRLKSGFPTHFANLALGYYATYSCEGFPFHFIYRVQI